MIDSTLSSERPLSVFLVINESSGGSGKDLPSAIEEKLILRGHKVTVFVIPKGENNLTDTAVPLVKQALAVNGVVVAAGGDGTVNTMASLCYKHKALLGVIPLGTFNYFARALGIPIDVDQSIEILSSGIERKVSAGFVQDHLFLVNASFGLYPKIIRKREEATSIYGRKRLVAAISAIGSLFREQKLFAIRLHHGDDVEIHRTSMVFVGNNTFQLENLGLEVGECTRQNKLAVVILKPVTRFETARLIWRGIVKNLKGEPRLEQFCSEGFEVETSRREIDIVLDGEILQCTSPLSFRVDAEAIRVIGPEVEGNVT